MRAPAENRRWVVARRPQGLPEPADFRLETGPVPEPGDGEVLVRAQYLSLDAAMHSWMSEARSYLPPVDLGEVMRGGIAGHVVASRADGFAPGDAVTGILGVQDCAVARPEDLTKVDSGAAPLPVHLSALGVPGATAYFGLLEVGALQPGERVVVSAAAGAVGSLAVQVAKVHGCKVVGIAGGEAKCRFVTEALGADACIDYKSEDVATAIRQHLRRGVQVYFDNVGGPILDAVLTQLARGARIVSCGAISQYGRDADAGIRNLTSLIVHRATMRGMLVFDYAERYGEAAAAIVQWMQQGRLQPHVDITEGFASFPAALARLYAGGNTGKALVRFHGDA